MVRLGLNKGKRNKKQDRRQLCTEKTMGQLKRLVLKKAKTKKRDVLHHLEQEVAGNQNKPAPIGFKLKDRVSKERKKTGIRSSDKKRKNPLKRQVVTVTGGNDNLVPVRDGH